MVVPLVRIMAAGARVLAALLLAAGLHGQTPLGDLLYADPVGRGIRLVVLSTGQPGRMTLRAEQGEIGRFRTLVLTLAGPERPPSASVQALVEPVPPAWKVDGSPRGTLIRMGETTYWRYAQGQVLPVRLSFDRKVWALQEANLPGGSFTTGP